MRHGTDLADAVRREMEPEAKSPRAEKFTRVRDAYFGGLAGDSPPRLPEQSSATGCRHPRPPRLYWIDRERRGSAARARVPPPRPSPPVDTRLHRDTDFRRGGGFSRRWIWAEDETARHCVSLLPFGDFENSGTGERREMWVRGGPSTSLLPLRDFFLLD